MPEALKRLIASKLLNQRAGDVTNGDVRFLDALRVARRTVQQQIHFVCERAAGFA
jgi:hypothetical protein